MADKLRELNKQEKYSMDIVLYILYKRKATSAERREKARKRDERMKY